MTLSAGSRPARTSPTPACAATAFAVSALSPVSIDSPRTPSAAQLGDGLSGAGAQRVAHGDDAERSRLVAYRYRRLAFSLEAGDGLQQGRTRGAGAEQVAAGRRSIRRPSTSARTPLPATARKRSTRGPEVGVQPAHSPATAMATSRAAASPLVAVPRIVVVTVVRAIVVLVSSDRRAVAVTGLVEPAGGALTLGRAGDDGPRQGVLAEPLDRGGQPSSPPSLVPSRPTTSVTSGRPTVSVPVLSKATASSLAACSRNTPPLMRTPLRVARASAARMLTGVEITSAQGQLMMSSASPR